MSLSKDVKLVREAIATLAANNSPVNTTAVSCLFDNLVNTWIVRKGVTIQAAEEMELEQGAVQKLRAERDAERIHNNQLVQENATLKDGQELARIRQLLKLEQDGSSKLHAERDAERIHCSELRGKIDQLVREKSLESRECPIASHSCLLTERDGALLENERLQSELSIANRNVDFWKEANDKEALVPIPMIMHCPMCHERHIDADEFKAHHTHACQSCGHCWRPSRVQTKGVQFLPGYKD